MNYRSRGLRRRRNSDKWEVTICRIDPMTGEQDLTYHTVEAKTEKQAKKKRDELILELERNGAAASSRLTLRELLDQFIRCKEEGKLVERSTIDHYRKQAKVINRYLGAHRLPDVNIPAVNGWMAQMISEGYAPRSVSTSTVRSLTNPRSPHSSSSSRSSSFERCWKKLSVANERTTKALHQLLCRLAKA